MLTISYTQEKRLLSIIYDGPVSLSDLGSIIVFAQKNQALFSKDINVLFDIRKGFYEFEVSEIAEISIEFDKVLEAFSSVRVVALRSRDNDPTYTEFFHMLSKQEGVEFFVFDEDEKGARQCLEEKQSVRI
ncbi:MAG: hypothetical protein OCC49_14415 [Fibrobacterales bacterium]